MPFWRDAVINDPKRAYRFILRTGVSGIKPFVIQSVKKPEVKFKETPLNYLGHTFYYIGPAQWSEIPVTCVDPSGNEDTAYAIATLLQRSGYRFPINENDKSSVSKVEAVRAVGNFIIDQLGAGDISEDTPIESWILHNAWVRDVDFGGDLKYEDEKLITLKMVIRYDWAELRIPGKEFIWT